MSRFTIPALAIALAGASASAGVTTVLAENFESTAGFTTSAAFFTDNGSDYFGINGGAADTLQSTSTSLETYSGFTGGFLNGEDLDAEGAGLPITVTWANLDISGLTDLSFSGLFAESTPASNGDFDIDAADSLKVQYSIDGSTLVDLLDFVGDDSLNDTTPDAFNGSFTEQTGGEVLGSAASTISRSIPDTGDFLTIVFSIDVDSGDEDFAIDDFTVTGTRVIPLPGGAALAFAGLLGVASVRRRA